MFLALVPAVGMLGYLIAHDDPGGDDTTAAATRDTSTDQAGEPGAGQTPADVTAVLVAALGAVTDLPGVDLLDPDFDPREGIAVTMDDGTVVAFGDGPVTIVHPDDAGAPGLPKTPVSVVGAVDGDGTFIPTPGLGPTGTDWMEQELDAIGATPNGDGTWNVPAGAFSDLPPEGCGDSVWVDGLSAATAGALADPLAGCLPTRTADGRGRWSGDEGGTVQLGHDVELNPTINLPVDVDGDGDIDAMVVCDSTACVILVIAADGGPPRIAGGFRFPDADPPEEIGIELSATAGATDPGLDADLSSKTIEDGTWLAAGEGFTMHWEMTNTGADAWSAADGFALSFIGGYGLGATAGSLPVEGTVESGGTAGFTVAMTAPDATGLYRGYWRMHRRDQPFGEIVWVDVDVGHRGSVAVQGGDPAAYGTVSVPFEADPRYGGSLDHLARVLESLPGVRVGAGGDATVDYPLGNRWTYRKRPPPELGDGEAGAFGCTAEDYRAERCADIEPDEWATSLVESTEHDTGERRSGGGVWDSIGSLFGNPSLPSNPITLPGVGIGVDLGIPGLDDLHALLPGGGWSARPIKEAVGYWNEVTDATEEYFTEYPWCVLGPLTLCNPVLDEVVEAGLEIVTAGWFCPLLEGHSTYATDPGSGPYPQRGYGAPAAEAAELGLPVGGGVPAGHGELLALARQWMPLLQYSTFEHCGKLIRVTARVLPYRIDGTRIVQPPFLDDAEYVEIQYTLFFEVDAGRFALAPHAGDNEGFVISLQRGQGCRGSEFELTGGYSRGHKDALGGLIHVSESHLDLRGCPGEEYRTYVSEGKHATYFNPGDCEKELMGAEECDSSLLLRGRVFDVSHRVELIVDDPDLSCQGGTVAGAGAYAGSAWPPPDQTFAQGEGESVNPYWVSGDRKAFYCQARGRDICTDPDDPYHLPGLAPFLAGGCALIEVPNLVGLSVEAAVHDLAELHLIGIEGEEAIVGVDTVADPDLVGVIALQDPAAGERRTPGSPVFYRVGVSADDVEIVPIPTSTSTTTTTTTTTPPPSRVIVPDVLGMTQAAAIAAIEGAGLRASILPEVWYSFAGGPDTVWDQSPWPGEQVDRGTTIYLTMQRWPDTPDRCEMLDGSWSFFNCCTPDEPCECCCVCVAP